MYSILCYSYPDYLLFLRFLTVVELLRLRPFFFVFALFIFFIILLSDNCSFAVIYRFFDASWLPHLLLCSHIAFNTCFINGLSVPIMPWCQFFFPDVIDDRRLLSGKKNYRVARMSGWSKFWSTRVYSQKRSLQRVWRSVRGLGRKSFLR